MAKKTSTTRKAGAAVDPVRQDAPPTVVSGSIADPYAAPLTADLWYIPEPLRRFAVRADSLVMDPLNVKDHGEVDLPAHQASLKKFGIRRILSARSENRQIEAGNGTVLAVLKNGWEYVPVIFYDDDQSKARAFALADNAIASLATWNDDVLKKLKEESDSLFDDSNLQGLAEQLLAGLSLDAVVDPPDVPDVSEGSGEDLKLSYRVIATCKDQDQQMELLKELKERGFGIRLSTIELS